MLILTSDSGILLAGLHAYCSLQMAYIMLMPVTYISDIHSADPLRLSQLVVDAPCRQLMDFFLAGSGQPLTDQPSNMAEGHPPLYAAWPDFVFVSILSESSKLQG
eukprot:scaffold83876_cov19-Tisochrysis_lutea.AAC.1